MKLPKFRNPFRKIARKVRRYARRGFAAAKSDRLLASWRIDSGFTPPEISSFLTAVRGHSREMQKDSELFKRYLQLFKVNVVGSGFNLRALSRNPDGTPDKETSRFIEHHWREFCNGRDSLTNDTYFDATGSKTEAEMDRLNAKTWARDGEYFLLVLRTSDNPYGISFRVLRPDWCDHTYNVSDTGRGTTIFNGVEKDTATRRTVAYFFSTAPKNGTGVTHHRGKSLIRIPAALIIHGFTQEDEGQVRGMPRGHAAIRKLKMIDAYDEAEITAARDEACSTRVYFAPRGDEESFEDITDDEHHPNGSRLRLTRSLDKASCCRKDGTRRLSSRSTRTKRLRRSKRR